METASQKIARLAAITSLSETREEKVSAIIELCSVIANSPLPIPDIAQSLNGSKSNNAEEG